MAPSWVRISQLHMKEERLWDGRLRERVRDCFDDEGREPTCFDRSCSLWIDALLMNMHIGCEHADVS